MGGGAPARPVQPSERVVEKVVHVKGDDQEMKQQLDEERSRIKQVTLARFEFAKMS